MDLSLIELAIMSLAVVAGSVLAMLACGWHRN